MIKKTLSFSCCVTLPMTLSLLLAGKLQFVVFVSSLLLLLMGGQRTQKINFFQLFMSQPTIEQQNFITHMSHVFINMC